MEDKQFQILSLDALAWARAHPSYFFRDGIVSQQSMVDQLVAGIHALGVDSVEVHAIGAGIVVASTDDWFTRARLPIPDTFEFQAMPAFPEQGQNCTRPEFVVAAFAHDVVIRGPSGTRAVKGPVSPTDPLLLEVARPSAWRRAVGFRGLVEAGRSAKILSW
jgi:hypothetical protein